MELGRLPCFATLTVSLLALGACNVFQPFDSPHNADQYLSKARACFDDRKFDCAAEYYQLAAADQPEVAASEEAFMLLDRAGADMGAFLSAAGNGDGSEGLTKLAGTLSNLSPEGLAAGKDKRLMIFDAYAKSKQITTNTELRGLVKFMASLALTAEILAEDTDVTGDTHSLEKGDLAAEPTTCAMFDLGGGIMAPTAGCNAPVGAKIIAPAVNPNIDINAEDAKTKFDGVPNFCMISAAATAIQSALVEISAGGDFGEGFSSLNTTLLAQACTVDPAYRYAILSFGVGN